MYCIRISNYNSLFYQKLLYPLLSLQIFFSYQEVLCYSEFHMIISSTLLITMQSLDK